MNCLIDGRVFAHRYFSGVEHYVLSITAALKQLTVIDVCLPKTDNRYLQHIWEHTLLPLATRKSDLLFCPSNIAPIWLPKKTKLVITLHDVAYKTFPTSVSKIFFWYYSYLIPKNISRAEQIITISESSKKEILRYYPQAQGKINVIPLGISAEFHPKEDIQKQRQILYIGSSNERKNLKGVIEAFFLLPDSLDLHLKIVTSSFKNLKISIDTQTLIERAKKYGKIHFVSGLSHEELVDEYNCSLGFIFPSFYEGFGLPPLEAMACGTPVIVSNSSSLPEICGDAALYIDPNNTKNMADTIIRLVENENLQQELRRKGLERVKHYTWEKAARKHMEVFEKVLEL